MSPARCAQDESQSHRTGQPSDARALQVHLGGVVLMHVQMTQSHPFPQFYWQTQIIFHTLTTCIGLIK